MVKLGFSGVLPRLSLEALILGDALVLSVDDEEELLLAELAGDGVGPVRARAEDGLEPDDAGPGPGGLTAGTGSGRSGVLTPVIGKDTSLLYGDTWSSSWMVASFMKVTGALM